MWTFKVPVLLKAKEVTPEGDGDVLTFAWSRNPAAPWPGQTGTSPSRLEQSWPRCQCRTCSTTSNSVIEAEAGTLCSLSHCGTACSVRSKVARKMTLFSQEPLVLFARSRGVWPSSTEAGDLKTVAHRSSVANSLAPLSLHITPIISCRRKLPWGGDQSSGLGSLQCSGQSFQ